MCNPDIALPHVPQRAMPVRHKNASGFRAVRREPVRPASSWRLARAHKAVVTMAGAMVAGKLIHSDSSRRRGFLAGLRVAARLKP